MEIKNPENDLKEGSGLGQKKKNFTMVQKVMHVVHESLSREVPGSRFRLTTSCAVRFSYAGPYDFKISYSVSHCGMARQLPEGPCKRVSHHSELPAHSPTKLSCCLKARSLGCRGCQISVIRLYLGAPTNA